MVVQGQLSADCDLTVMGEVAGAVDLGENQLTVTAGAKLRADATARSVLVFGAMSGTIRAANVEINSEASVDGEIRTRRISIAAGAEMTAEIVIEKKDGGTHAGQRSMAAGSGS